MNPYRMPLQRIRAAASWHVSSLEVARRNARTASVELARRRVELEDVEIFLAEHAARRRTGRRAGARPPQVS